MEVYSAAGLFLRSFAVPAGYATQTIAFDNLGHFFLASIDGAGVSAFNLSGNLLASGVSPALPSNPSFGSVFIAADNSGNVYEWEPSATALHQFSFTDTPEPSYVGLLALGALLLGAKCGRRR